jgi:hypothetical protein
MAKGTAVSSGGFSASDPTTHTFGLGFFQQQKYIQLVRSCYNSSFPVTRSIIGAALLKYSHYSTIDLRSVEAAESLISE